MPFSLGSIYFNLGADTRGLARAGNDLRAIERQVNRFAAMQGDGARRAEAAWRKQEAAATSALNKIQNLTNRMRLQGVDAGLIDRAQASLNTYVNELASARLRTVAFQRSTETFNASLARTQQAFSQTTAGLRVLDREIAHHARQVATALNLVDREMMVATRGIARTRPLVSMFRDFASSAVLLAGPLSGFATRIVALTAVFSRSGVAATAFFGGLAGGIYVMGRLAQGAFSAGRAFQSYRTILEAAYLSQTRANEGLQFAIDVAERAGQSIGTLIPTWARFSATVRGTKVEQVAEDIFETFAQAGARLRIPQEQMAGIFRALDQMVSKGTVFREELVQQLGDRFPGALRLAAEAMGVTTAEFNKMTAAGAVASEDFLPKFAARVREVFNIRLGGTVNNLESTINRMSNAWQLFLVELDKTLGVTSTVGGALERVTDALKAMTDDMGNTISIVKAVASGLAVLAGPAILKGIYALTAALYALTVRAAALNTVFTRSTIGRIIQLVSLLAAGVAVAITVFKSAESKIKDIVLAEGEWIDSMGNVIGALNAVQVAMGGMAQQQDNLAAATERMEYYDNGLKDTYIKNTQEMVDAAIQRTAHLQQQLNLQIQLLKAQENSVIPERLRGGILGPSLSDRAKNILELEEALKKSQDVSIELQQSLSQLMKGDFQGSHGRDPLAWLEEDLKGASEDVQELVNEFLGLERVVKSLPQGLEATLKAQDLEEARDILRGLSQQELTDLSEKLQLVGFSGATLDEQLQSLITQHRKLEDQINSAINGWEKEGKALDKTERAMRRFMHELTQAQERLEAMKQGRGALERWEVLQRNEDAAFRFGESLRSAGFSAEFATEKSRMLFEVLQETDALEKALDPIYQLQDVLINGLGSALDSVIEDLAEWQFSFDGLRDAARQLVIDLIKTFARLAILNPILNSLFDRGLPTLGSGDGLLGKLFRRQGGGPGFPGVPTLVGEKRPEVFIPSTYGRFDPAPGSGGGGSARTVTLSPQFNIDARGATPDAVKGLRQEMHVMFTRMRETLPDMIAQADLDHRL